MFLFLEKNILNLKIQKMQFGKLYLKCKKGASNSRSSNIFVAIFLIRNGDKEILESSFRGFFCENICFLTYFGA